MTSYNKYECALHTETPHCVGCIMAFREKYNTLLELARDMVLESDCEVSVDHPHFERRANSRWVRMVLREIGELE